MQHLMLFFARQSNAKWKWEKNNAMHNAHVYKWAATNAKIDERGSQTKLGVEMKSVDLNIPLFLIIIHDNEISRSIK